MVNIFLVTDAVSEFSIQSLLFSQRWTLLTGGAGRGP